MSDQCPVGSYLSLTSGDDRIDPIDDRDVEIDLARAELNVDIAEWPQRGQSSAECTDGLLLLLETAA